MDVSDAKSLVGTNQTNKWIQFK